MDSKLKPTTSSPHNECLGPIVDSKLKPTTKLLIFLKVQTVEISFTHTFKPVFNFFKRKVQ